jgi:hypothetical protein
MVAGIVAVAVGSTYTVELPPDGSWYWRLVMFPVVLALLVPTMLLPTLAGAILVGAAVPWRIVAWLGLAAYGLALALLPIATLGLILDLVGVDLATIAGAPVPPAGQAAKGELTLWETLALAVLTALCAVAAYEGLGWAWWQARVAEEGYLAARGWRVPRWRLFSTFRRMLGVPAFISNFGRDRLALTVSYFVVVLFNTGIAAVFAVPFLLFALGSAGLDPAITKGMIVALGLLLAFNVLGANRGLAALADKRATRQYQSVREWDARPPLLFLRSFDQDDERLPASTRNPLLKLPAGVSAGRTLDEILLEHGSPYGPVLAIGNPRDPIPPLGAARIFVPGAGAAWQDVVMSLVEASKAVVVCPSDTEGVRWELGLVGRDHIRGRVIYLANPELPVETTLRLFSLIVPGARAVALPPGQSPLATFPDGAGGWRMLTTSRPPCVQTYTIALNIALQAIFGLNGVPLQRPQGVKGSPSALPASVAATPR